ncbi:MAG: PKD domain-containing protein, partial [Actinomycetota bacterium]|nr:PKD domain-containing protein [Actinomycetota bacterium]
ASTFGPRNPGAVVFPYEAGRVAWEGVSNGVALRVRIDSPAPRVGEPVRFTVEAETHDHACCGLYLLYGDGGSSNGQMVWPGGSCDTAVPGKSGAGYTHTYNRAGRWEFSFQAVTGRCGVDNIYTGLHGYLEVAPGVSRSQGPALPVVNQVLEARAPNDPVVPGSLQVWAEAEDTDGFVSGFVVDFGDGTPAETFLGDRMGCRPTPSGWPARSLAWLRDPYASHRYATPGTYTITVTAVSTGCDGGERQAAAATMTYVW